MTRARQPSIPRASSVPLRNPGPKDPKLVLLDIITTGRNPPARAPTSPIKLPATAVLDLKRRGTNWKTAPFPAPIAEKQTTRIATMIQGFAGIKLASTVVATMTLPKTMIARMPPIRSAIHPPQTRRILAMMMIPAE